MPTSDSQSVINTLPAHYYTNPDLFRDELERFYCQTWICAGRADQVPEPADYFLREIADESVIITRDQNRSLRAFFNVCRHRGTRICATAEGNFPGRIQCGYHGWTYALDGSLIGAPFVHDGFCREDYPLNRVHADVWDGHIFINLSSEPVPLASQLDDLPRKTLPWNTAELRTHRRIKYEVKANWKLIVLNYSECQHCPILHPTLNAVTDYLSGENDPPHSGYIGGSMDFRGGAQTMSLDGEAAPRLSSRAHPKRTQQGLLLRDFSQSAAKPPSGLCNDAHSLAARCGSYGGYLRMAFPSGRNR